MRNTTVNNDANVITSEMYGFDHTLNKKEMLEKQDPKLMQSRQNVIDVATGMRNARILGARDKIRALFVDDKK